MKETRDDICKNVLKKDKLGNDIGQESINDDLEGFISDLQKNSLRPDSKWLYFLPKVAARGPISETSKRKYRDYCILKRNPDVPEEEMALSESKSKFCYSVGWRKTIIFENYEKVVLNSGRTPRTGQKRKINDTISKLEILDIIHPEFSMRYRRKNRLKSKNK